jgi:hypothetical protein
MTTTPTPRRPAARAALATAAAVVALTLGGCAAMDAAHIAGQTNDTKKFTDYTDVQYQQQLAVQACFTKASTDNQIAMCALMGQGLGMASTFGGRPTTTTVAPTTMQALGDTIKGVAPAGFGAWAAARIAGSVARVQAKDPVVVTQPAPLVVEPTIVEVPVPATTP